MQGLIVRIERFALHDGDGIRTVVFLKGCPLRCQWCHNPESHLFTPELSWDEEKCRGCGRCQERCPAGCHQFAGEGHRHVIHREECRACGKCADGCVHQALTLVGKEVTAPELMAEVQREQVFYGQKGGVTFSGGEPLLQNQFLLECCKLAHEGNLRPIVETCGYAPWEHMQPLLPYVHTFYYDVKILDDGLHRRYTGVSNQQILDNLRQLDASGAKIVLRCPIIPGINDNDQHLQGIAQLANKLSHVERVDLEPYHPMGVGKYAMVGRASPLPLKEFPPREVVLAWQASVSRQCSVPVVVA